MPRPTPECGRRSTGVLSSGLYSTGVVLVGGSGPSRLPGYRRVPLESVEISRRCGSGQVSRHHGRIVRVGETPRQRPLSASASSVLCAQKSTSTKRADLLTTASVHDQRHPPHTKRGVPLINLKGIVDSNTVTANPPDPHSTTSRPDAPAGSGDGPQTSRRGTVGPFTTPRRRWRQ